jgi:predicted phosphodiesterase
MRYLLFSDVHANQPALDAVLREARARNDLTGVYHLGDLVGYAPWPNEVVATIAAAGIPGVAGNYDSTVATDYEHCGCKYEDPRQEQLAHESYEWTRANVSAETKRWLGGLPFRIDIRPLGGHTSGPTVTLVHGNHVLNTFYMYEDRSDDMLRRMAETVGARAGSVICFGHTHKPWHRVVDEVHFVNTGSAGRPKDGDPRAGYVLLDVTATDVHIEFVRVEYDVEAAARAIVASALPDEFADYLRTGGRSGGSVAPATSSGSTR